MTEAALVVITNLPDAASAERLAKGIVEQRLAACVNIMSPCRSIYRWQGAVEDASEVPVFIKTTAERYNALEEAVRTLHPYSVPEIVAMPITAGLAAYLGWVAEETRGELRA